MYRKLVALTIVLGLVFGLTACGKKTTSETVSDAVQDAGEAVGDAAKATGDAVDDAATATGDAVEDATK